MIYNIIQRVWIIIKVWLNHPQFCQIFIWDDNNNNNNNNN